MRIPRIALLLLVAIAGTAFAATRYDPKYDQIVLAEGCDLPTTAVESQQELIGRLLQSGRDQAPPAKVTIDYPLDESIFPPEIIPPTFLWHDADAAADRWLVDIAFAAGPARIRVLLPGPPPAQGEIDPIAVSSTNEVYQPTPYQASARSWKPSRDLWQTIKQCARPEAPIFVMDLIRPENEAQAQEWVTWCNHMAVLDETRTKLYRCLHAMLEIKISEKKKRKCGY